MFFTLLAVLQIVRCSYTQMVHEGDFASTTTTGPWYESLPAVAMDYKVHVDPGKEDCYFQYVNPGATFYTSFQVLRGGDGMAGFAVRNPSGVIVHPYEWQAQSDYQDQTDHGGYYSICIDNQFSRFAAKLVNLYITVIRYDKWNELNKEIEQLNLNVTNFIVSQVVVQYCGGVVGGVQQNINEILQHQHHTRSRESRDYLLLSDNSSYVFKWSVVQIVCILLTSCAQIYFVRQLFETSSISTNRKRPHA